ncbi:MAG: hypothetical protein M0038_05605 [Pseudomonadota bacterium]|jgi:hypothetical protein|nr:hypothetical protein [Pseudomonadota bacterium]
MTHKASSRILATIPDRYSPDFADRLDRRTSIAKAIRGRIEAIETDLGGVDVLSHARRSLVRRVVWLEAIIEHSEQRLAAGEGIDLGGHTQAINSLLGLYRLLGLERRQRPTRTLRDIMAEPRPVSPRAVAAGQPSAAPEPSYNAKDDVP